MNTVILHYSYTEFHTSFAALRRTKREDTEVHEEKRLKYLRCLEYLNCLVHLSPVTCHLIPDT